MADDAKAVVRAVVDDAKGGNMTAARLILDLIGDTAPLSRKAAADLAVLR